MHDFIIMFDVYNKFSNFFINKLIVQGIRSTGGIGDKMEYLNLYDGTNNYIMRVFYDMFNHWLLNILFLNLILGIIIDAFACNFNFFI